MGCVDRDMSCVAREATWDIARPRAASRAQSSLSREKKQRKKKTAGPCPGGRVGVMTRQNSAVSLARPLNGMSLVRPLMALVRASWLPVRFRLQYMQPEIHLNGLGHIISFGGHMLIGKTSSRRICIISEENYSCYIELLAAIV